MSDLWHSLDYRQSLLAAKEHIRPPIIIVWMFRQDHREKSCPSGAKRHADSHSERLIGSIRSSSASICSQDCAIRRKPQCRIYKSRCMHVSRWRLQITVILNREHV
jgi:hypothetical protein